MDVIFPPHLERGDLVRVVAPSRSKAMVDEHDNSGYSATRFAEMGLSLSFGDHVLERDSFDSSSVASRIADLHTAFADPEVRAIMTVIGGFNSNELLPYLDWDLIKANPKIFCGFSDITALQNAIFAHTGLVTYSGPHWSTFGMRDHLEQTQKWFVQALTTTAPMAIEAALKWTDDAWFLHQDHRTVLAGDGWWPLQEGATDGRIIGGNLCTLNLLQGTAYMPPLDGAVLFLEDDHLSNPVEFARDLNSLLQVPAAAAIRGLVIGRFQQASGVSRDLLAKIIKVPAALSGLPVLANVDFGHTSPLLTYPIGGEVSLRVGSDNALVITKH